MEYISSISKLNLLTLRQLEDLFDASTSQDKGEYFGYDEAWYEELAFKIAGSGQAGTDFLLNHSTTVEEARLRAILAALSWPKEKSEHIKQLVRRHLNDPRPVIIVAAIDTARHLGYTEFLDEVLAQQHHTSPYVVGSVLRYLAQLYPVMAKPLLLAALESREPIVVQNAIDELEGMDVSEALPRIRQLLNHPEGDVRQAARTAVNDLERQSDQN